MKIKIVINTMTRHPDSMRTSEVWSGELDIMPEGEYLTKISIIAEGIEHPICDIPFSPVAGHWRWIPPLIDNERLEEIEEEMREAKDNDR